jgi:hypothetical protein
LKRGVSSIHPDLQYGFRRGPTFAREADMFDVFRFAWFCVRTYLGVIGLVLTLYGALWLFVKIDSARSGNATPDAALQRVKYYNAQAGMKVGKAQAALPAASKN